MKDLFLLAILFTLLGELPFALSAKNHTLKGLVVFHRHGARLPAVEDYYKEDWPSHLEKGDLTDKGIT